MKNFKCPVSMLVSNEQAERMKTKLNKLGYEDNGVCNHLSSIIYTNAGGNKQYYSTSDRPSSYREDCGRHYIDNYNPDLFLALAAIVDDEFYHEGEWVVFMGISNGASLSLSDVPFTVGKLYKIGERSFVENTTGFYIVSDDKGKVNGYSYAISRKATKEEIIEKFNGKPMKKIIGYKAPQDLFNGDIKKGDLLIENEGYYKTQGSYRKKDFNPNSYNVLPKELVETWKPVYEQEEVKFQLHGSEKAVTILIKEKGLFWVEGENVNIPIDNVRNLIVEKFCAGWTIQPQVWDIGCIKGITRKELNNILVEHDKLFK